MKTSSLLFCLSSLFFCSHLFAYAQEDQSNKLEAVKGNTETEVISIVGKRPVLYFRRQVRVAKWDFYDAYNQLVSDPKYQVICRREKIAAHRRKKVCVPQYVIDKKRELLEDESAGDKQEIALTPSKRKLAFAVKETKEEAKAEMKRLIASHPALKEKYLKIISSLRRYELSHVNAFGSWSRYHEKYAQQGVPADVDTKNLANF